MIVKFTVARNGETKTEVVDREGQNCKNVLKVTQALGKEKSHEITGPDCDKVDEAQL